MRIWRKVLATAVSVGAASIVLVQPVVATPPTPASGTILVTGLTVTSTRSTGPNTILTGVNTLAISGDVSGSATYEFTQVNHASGALNSHGVVTCACTIGGASGTVVLAVAGTGALGPPTTFSGTATVLSADGGLEGLHGVFTFDQTGAVAPYSGTFHFEP